MLKNILYISLFATFVIAVWIGLTIYNNFSKTTLSATTQTQIIPIDPSFSPKTIEEIKKRKQINADLSETITVSAPEKTSTSSASGAPNSLQTEPSTLPLEGEGL